MPRDIIKFELADAKVPDFHPDFQQRYQNGQKPTQRPRQRKAKKQEKNAPTAKTDGNVAIDNQKSAATSTDQSGSDSRVLTIAHMPSRHRSIKQLPFSVQKAINHALKQEIPFLDTIKYYFKDPTPKTSKLAVPSGAKLFSDSRIKQWWQAPPYFKGATSPSAFSSTSSKPATASSLLTNEYVGASYPLLRAYPVHYSMNVASDLLNGYGYLYGDRIYQKNVYAKPFSYHKNPVTASIKPLDHTIRPIHEDDEFLSGGYHTSSTPNSIISSSISSTSPITFPSSTDRPMKPQSIVNYYSAEMPSSTTEPTAASLTSDKNTINLINKAITALKKHNPHLNVVPKRLENDELIVHVTPKPEFFIKSTTTAPAFNPVSVSEAFNTNNLITEKNLIYLNKVVGSNKVLHGHNPVGNNKQNNKEVINHAYLTHIEAPENVDDLVCSTSNVFKTNKKNFVFFLYQLHFCFQYESGYAFGYRVRDHNTGNDFGHTQKRMVDGTTHGEYKILMPDGRTQNVKYKADDHGYHADVSYDV